MMQRYETPTLYNGASKALIARHAYDVVMLADVEALEVSNDA